MSQNRREMTGALKALKRLINRLPRLRQLGAVSLSSRTLLFRTDNMTVMAYVRNQGGRVKELTALALQMWQIATASGYMLDAVHIPGKLNVRSDTLSRVFPLNTEWKLNPEVFRRISRSLGPFTLDLFASETNAQLPRFVTWRYHPDASGTDAFLVPWEGERLWAFPPVKLIGRVLQHLQDRGGQLTLLTPDWPSQPWWPTAQSLQSQPPMRITHPELLIGSPSSSSAPPFSACLVWSLSCS